jgi:hypothetical protein
VPVALSRRTEGSGLDKVIQIANKTLEALFNAENDDNVIKTSLDLATAIVRKGAGDPTRRQHFRTESEFASYVKPGSDGEQKFVNFLRRIQGTTI